MRFYLVLATFQKRGWVQAPKELTLSVLEDVSRRIEKNGAQDAGKRCKAPRRIYVAFGEHPAAEFVFVFAVRS